MKNLFLVLTGLTLFCGVFTSCKKDIFITSKDARLSTSADSLKFDTVFTVTGSITKSFKILNNNDQKLLLSKIKLGGGLLSPSEGQRGGEHDRVSAPPASPGCAPCARAAGRTQQ